MEGMLDNKFRRTEKEKQKKEFELKGIKNWHKYRSEMIPNDTKLHEKSFREEAVKLLEAGFNLAINTEHGVGSIRVLKDLFVIELWQYDKKQDIYKETLDEVLDWIIYFYDQNIRDGRIVRY